MAVHPSASFSETIRVRLPNEPGSFARLAQAIGDEGGLLDAIDLVRAERGTKVRDVTVLASDAEQMTRIVAAVGALEGVEVVNVSDRTFLVHLGGKIEVGAEDTAEDPERSVDGLHAGRRACLRRRSHEDPEKVWSLTIKQNTVAVVTDGTAVLGLGDIGPEAALPVMEGKAMLFKEFGGVDAFPICLDTKDPGRDRARS